MLEFADGAITLVSVRAVAGGALVSQAINNLNKHLPNVNVRIVALVRDNKHLNIDAHSRIEPGDEVFYLSATKDVQLVMSELRRVSRPVAKVMIAGGGNIGLRVANRLEKNYQVKLIEFNRQRCEELTHHVQSNTLVLYGDATDEDLLDQENVQEVDTFIALTNDDENNIMSALLAKRMGARRVISLIQRKVYADLVQGGQIDIALAPSNATLSELLRHIRRGDVVAVHRLRRGGAEVIEMVVHGDAQSSHVIGKPLAHVKLPKGVVIGGIVRDKQVLMLGDEEQIESGDHVILFVENRRLVPEVEKLFQVSVAFL